MTNAERHPARNISIGLVDGLTIPLALAAGLSRIVTSVSPVIIACLAATVAGSITMSVGGFFQSRKYTPSQNSGGAALFIGLGYLLGGVSVIVPYLWKDQPMEAFERTTVHTMIFLFAAGYDEGKQYGSNGWLNGLRVCVTAAIVAAAAYFIAGLFR